MHLQAAAHCCHRLYGCKGNEAAWDVEAGDDTRCTQGQLQADNDEQDTQHRACLVVVVVVVRHMCACVCVSVVAAGVGTELCVQLCGGCVVVLRHCVC